MHRLTYLLLVLLALSLSSCGQTVVETLQVPEKAPYDAPGTGRSIVILPFADYSQGNIESALRRNMAVTESLTDRLSAYGFGQAVQEDVFDYLVQEQVINLAGYATADTGSLAVELNNDWSENMKEEIQRYKTQVEEEVSNQKVVTPGAHGLDQRMVAKIGRHFNADYVLRGRILEFKTRQEATWAPWKKGLLPFVNGGANRILHGFASSEAYDQENEEITGMLLFGKYGYDSAHWPWKRSEDVLARDGRTANTIMWGSVGYQVGGISHRSGQVDQAAVELRIWVQEAATGNVVWTNRIRVLVSPETFLADKQYDTLFNLAIEKGVTTMMDNFVATGL